MRKREKKRVEMKDWGRKEAYREREGPPPL